jgi:hypothetical protein
MSSAGNGSSTNIHRSSSASFAKPGSVKGASTAGSGIHPNHEAMLSASQNFSQMGLGGVSVSSTTNADTKERAYMDKIKTLKAENKKLIGLLRDSEKLFY